MFHVQFAEQAVDLCHPGGAVFFDQFRHGQYILFHCHAPENRGLLRKIAHAEACALIHGKTGHILAVDRNFSRIDADQAHDHVKAGRFAGPVGSKQANNLSALKRKRDIPHDLSLAK